VSNISTYYPHHLPTGGTYAGVALLAVLAVISIIKKIIFVAFVLVVVAVGVALYHHGVINQLLQTGGVMRVRRIVG